MSYKIRFSRQSGEDLQSIYNYHSYNLMLPDQADRIIKNIKGVIKSLRTFPFRNKTVRDLKITELAPPNSEIRSVVIDGYRIYYCVKGVSSEIIILTILRNTEN